MCGLNGTPSTVAQLNDLPIKLADNATIYLRDVATVSDGFAPQTNIVRQDGKRGVLVTILKAGDASTINVVNGIRGMLPRVAQTLPPQLQDSAPRRPVDLRQSRDQRRGPRGGHRGRV